MTTISCWQYKTTKLIGEKKNALTNLERHGVGGAAKVLRMRPDSAEVT